METLLLRLGIDNTPINYLECRQLISIQKDSDNNYDMRLLFNYLSITEYAGFLSYKQVITLTTLMRSI